MAPRGRRGGAPDGALAVTVSPTDALPAGPGRRGRRGAGCRTCQVAYRPIAALGPLTFTRLKWTSFTHSCVYAGLLCAAIAGWATPTLILGWTHGLLWIVMSLACIAAVRLRVDSAARRRRGGGARRIGPFFGSYEFVREQRRRASPRQGASQGGHTTDE